MSEPIRLQDARTAPSPIVSGIPTQSAVAKGPCSCGCLPIKIPFTTPAHSRATPEFKALIQDRVKTLLSKASEVKTTGGTLYSTPRCAVSLIAGQRSPFLLSVGKSIPPPTMILQFNSQD